MDPSIERRRRLLATLAAAAALSALTTAATPALAQAPAWPARPVKFIVPFPPGGAIDTLARLTAQHLSTAWGQPATVENRPGAGGLIGSDALAKSAPDGYTFGWGAVSTHGINATLYRKVPYDTVRDFATVAPVAIVPNLLVVGAGVPAKTLQDLVAIARQQPGKLSYASAGSGSTLHISCELVKKFAGIDMLHVPYKGSGPALTDVLSGQVPVMCDSVTSALPHIRAGKLRALGITSSQRSTMLPDVPTLAQAGLAGYEMNPWFGVFAPAGTPAAIVAQVNRDIRRMLALPEVKARLAEIGAEPMDATPEQFADMVRGDVEKWRKLIPEMGIAVD